MCCSKSDCCCHCSQLEVESVALEQGTTATITIAPESLNNRRLYTLRYCVKFTDATGEEVLQITNGTSTYPVWDKYGEALKIGRLRRGETLDLYFLSAGTAHFTLKSCAHPICLKTPEPAN